jgi:hypothetical protein
MHEMRRLMSMMEAEQPVHPFEAAGLGKAPFRCVGAYSLPSPSMAEQNPTAYQNAMREMPRGIGIGTCAYCGMGLTHNFIINSADDRKFVVGSDCVAKTHDKGLVNSVKVEITKARRLAKHAARQAKYEQWKLENADRLAAEQAERDAKEAALQAERHAMRGKWEFLLRHLQGDAPFVSSMREMIERGEAPQGRAASILAEIYAKAHGRRGSKGYYDALDDFESRTGVHSSG